MRILVINKYIPPEPAPTAVLAGDLAAMLEDLGAEVAHLGADIGYRGIRPKGLRRWVHEVRLLLRLFWKGLIAKSPDCIVCFSDPPGVLFVAALLARIKGVKLAHWAMDVYPDTAAALGEVRPGGPVHRLARLAMAWGYRSCKLIACLDNDMLRHLSLQNDPRAFVSSPWPPLHLSLPQESVAPQSHRIRWVYSGNLGRAHEYETLLRTQKVLEESGQPFDLVFQGGGNAWSAAKSLAMDLGLQHCHWESYVPSEKLATSLLQAHVLVATQRSEVKGLLWPSKLALLKMLPRPIVWVGPPDGTIAADLQMRGSTNGVFAAGDFLGLASWLTQRTGQFAKESSIGFSPAMLKPACLSVAHAEGEKWWFHLTHSSSSDLPFGTSLKVPLPDKPA